MPDCGIVIEPKWRKASRFKLVASFIESNEDCNLFNDELRVRGLKSPQILLKKFFQAKNIQSLDLYEDFTLRDSEDYFLYGDPMHFSYYGHKTVANKMLEKLK